MTIQEMQIEYDSICLLRYRNDALCAFWVYVPMNRQYSRFSVLIALLPVNCKNERYLMFYVISKHVRLTHQRFLLHELPDELLHFPVRILQFIIIAEVYTYKLCPPA